MSKMRFFAPCVSWPLPVEDLNLMIRGGESREISRKTFLKYVNQSDMKQLEGELGYDKHGLTMAKDSMVGYYKSTLVGCPVVYFVWSAIEHVFVDLYCLNRKLAERAASR